MPDTFPHLKEDSRPYIANIVGMIDIQYSHILECFITSPVLSRDCDDFLVSIRFSHDFVSVRFPELLGNCIYSVLIKVRRYITY